MARDYVDLGATPSDENCAQLGTPGYRDQARTECAQYIEQLKRTHPVPEHLTGDTAYLIRRHEHDFGTYYEVALRYDPTNAASCDFAYEVEGGCPPYWDQLAADELYAGGWLAVKRQYAPNAGAGAATELLPFPIV